MKVPTTVPSTATAASAANNGNRKAIFKTFAPIADSISEINKTQVDNVKDIDEVMPICNLIKYTNNYSKTSRTLW